MKIISLAVVLLLIKCSFPEKAITNFQKVDIVYKFPSFVKEDSVIVFTDSSSIIKYRNYKIYILPMGEELEEYGELVFDTIKYVYIGFDTSKKVGFQVNRLTDSVFKKVPVDSVLQIRPAITFLESIQDSSIFKREEIFKKDGIIKQSFILKLQAFDSMHLYFKKDLRKLDFFSLSKKTDSAYNSKLVEIKLFLSGKGLYFSKELTAEQRVASIRIFKNENIDEDKLKAFIQHMDHAYKKAQ
ncbi:MAG: hypothetical protein WAT19_11770 [Ferruginibacter sp.]